MWGSPHFNGMNGQYKNTGRNWSSAIVKNGREDRQHACPLLHQGTIDRSSPLSTTAPVSSDVSLDCFAIGTSLRKNVARMVAPQKTRTAIKPCWMATARESLSASNTWLSRCCA